MSNVLFLSVPSHGHVNPTVERVMRDPGYLANIRKIAASFEAAGGYPRAVEDIFTLKRARGVGD